MAFNWKSTRVRFDFEEVFVAKISTTHIVMVITDLKGWSIWHINVINAFLHGNLKEKNIYDCFT